MSESSQLHGTVIRIAEVATGIGEGLAFTLAGIGIARGALPSRAEWVEIAGIDANLLAPAENSKPSVQGALTDGRFVEIEIGDALPAPEGNANGAIRFGVIRLRCIEYRPAGWGTPAWVFSLLNFKLGDRYRSGLLQTTELREDGNAAWYRDTTSFAYANREWFLTDLLDGARDEELREFKNQWKPVCSAELWTERRDGDQREAVELLARDIANVLSFATGRCVRWLECTQLNAREQNVGKSRYSIWATGAKEGGSGPIDTGDAKNFQTFMNAACKAVEADPEWWARTLELHLQGALSPIVDVQLTFYYILLERVSSKVNGSYEPQIDAGLKVALRRPTAKSQIHDTFKAIIPTWTERRTNQVIDQVQKWNAEPSMPDRVLRAAVALGLPEPDAKKVNPRNPMLHQGELPSELPEDLCHSGDLARAVEALISAMLLRMLGHSGPAYLDDAGREHLPIYPWPKERPCPWTPA